MREAKEAKAKGEVIHMARAHGICVEKHSQLPLGDPKRKFKGRGVLLGNQVKNQSFERCCDETRLGELSCFVRGLALGGFFGLS